MTGVLVYGLIGYGVDRWLGTRGFVVLGITVGAGLGIYLVFKKFGHDPGDTRHDHSHTT
ncbi:hypothetical protein ACOACO_14940 [Nocardioides sp. CPCC 205120]|uniref:hypothetical protein n=1 Tax=Nocardioides sp. CPCC 205120 TaxID=3406462 RepID=UPI003B50A557